MEFKHESKGDDSGDQIFPAAQIIPEKYGGCKINGVETAVIVNHKLCLEEGGWNENDSRPTAMLLI